MLLIIKPFPLVASSILVQVHTIPMSLVILPLSFINIAISVFKLALAICFVISPISLVT